MKCSEKWDFGFRIWRFFFFIFQFGIPWIVTLVNHSVSQNGCIFNSFDIFSECFYLFSSNSLRSLQNNQQVFCKKNVKTLNKYMKQSDPFDRSSKLILCKFATLKNIVSCFSKDLNGFHGIFTQ